jgi:hypothetical protein
MKAGWRSRLGVPSICVALWVWEKGNVAGWWLLRWLPRTRGHFTTRRQGAYLLSLTRIPQLSRDVTVDAGFMCDTAAVLWCAMKETLCIYDLHVFTSRYVSVGKMTRLRCGWLKGESWFECRRSKRILCSPKRPDCNVDRVPSGKAVGAVKLTIQLPLVST